jgi:hypothetical protein
MSYRRNIPWALAGLTVSSLLIGAFAGPAEESVAPASTLSVLYRPFQISEPVQTILGDFADVPKILTITSSEHRNGSWTVNATFGRERLRPYVIPPHMIGTVVDLGTFHAPLQFVDLPDQTLPGFVLMSSSGGTGEPLTFFSLAGSRITPIAVTDATSPNDVLELGYSAGFGIGIECSWNGGFSLIRSDFGTGGSDVPSHPVEVEQTQFRLSGTHELVAMPLATITEPQSAGYANSQLEC